MKLNIKKWMNQPKTKTIDMPFPEGVEHLGSDGYRLISMPEQTSLRVLKGKNNDMARLGNFTSEAWVHVPGANGVYFVKQSPLTTDASGTKAAYDEQRDLYVSGDQSLENAVLVPFAGIRVPVARFGEEELTAIMLGEDAQEYGLLLQDAGRESIGIFTLPEGYVAKQDQSFARQNWFEGHLKGGMIGGDHIYSNCRPDRLVGIKHKE